MAETRKTLAFILPIAYGTGGINVLYEYGRRLKKRGYNVIYYIPLKAYNLHRGNPAVDLARQIYASFKMVKIYYLDGKLRQVREEMDADIRLVPVIRDRYIEPRDAVFASAWVTAYDVDSLKIDRRKKWYFIQDYEVWDNPELGRGSYRLDLSRVVIAAWIREKIAVECGIDREKIAVINNGIDTAKFSNPDKQYKGKGKKLQCLMLDHPLAKKGVANGIAAFEHARKEYPNLELVMFGVKRSAYAPEGIRYYEDPPQELLVRLYRESDIFIFPSLEEGWGLTPVEAMACRCAVAGTRVGCMLDIGRDRENALLSEPGDVAAMAANILELARDEELRRNISENGCAAVQRLDWERAADRLVQLIEGNAK